MYKNSVEDLTIKQIENGIRGIKLGTKKPIDVDIPRWLNKLEVLNKQMHNELENRFNVVMDAYTNKIK